MTHKNHGRAVRARIRNVATGVLLSACFASELAMAAPPNATGQPLLAAATGEQINLRSQRAVSGTAPMTITNASIVSVDPTITVSSFNGVCVVVSNPQSIPYEQVNAQLQVTLSNVDAPGGLPFTIPLQTGAGNNDLAACADPNASPTANAGFDLTVFDTNGAPGEAVLLDGSASVDNDVADGGIISYAWTDLTTNQSLGVSAQPTLTAALSDGVHQIQLTVTDNSGDSATSTDSAVITVTVQPPGPAANAGPDQTLTDTDRTPGEDVTLDGSASTAVSGAIVSYEWFDENEQLLGTGAVLNIRLATDGVHNITLIVTDSNQSSSTDTVTITVSATPPTTGLASLANLKPSQRSLATAMDDLCLRLAQSGTRSDLLDRCNGIILDPSAANQIEALEQLSAEDYNAIHTQTLFFANTQTSGVMERLMALRGGASGLSLSGLALSIDGKLVPAAQLAMLAEKVGEMLGVSGEGDGAEEPGSLLGDKLGLWMRGNFGNLDKDDSSAGRGFTSDQWSMTAGLDYRFTSKFVAGLSAGYGDSSLDYRARDRGGLETSSWTGSLYGSAYVVGNFYVDGVFNYSSSDFESERHIAYHEGATLIDRTASGETDGEALSGALSMGYDFQLGGLTVSPTLGLLRTEADVDEIVESGAGGLDLIIGERSFSSSTATGGLRVVYALKFPWGVLLPHFRGEYVREFEDEAEVFGVRFVDDPYAGTSDPTPPIVVLTDTPDQSYWKLTAGASAQFKYGVSAYAEYQRLEAFDFVSYDDFTIGLRLQQGF